MFFPPSWHSSVRESWTPSAAVVRTLVAAGLIVSAGLLTFSTIAFSDMRDAEREHALQSTTNVAASLEGNIARNIEFYDLSLQTVIDNLALLEVQQMSPAARHQVLFGRASAANHLGGILVINEDGHATINSHNLQPRWNDYSHREYFRVHRDNPDIGLFISRPFRSNSGKYVITLSRRLSDADGSFAGVVVGALRVSYFQELFERVTLAPNAAMGVYRLDGTLLARFPFNAQDMRFSVGKTPMLQQAAAEPIGHREVTAAPDGVRRLYSYRRIGDQPLVVVVGIPVAEIYARWWHLAWSVGLVELLLVAATIGFALATSFAFRKKLAAEKNAALNSCF